MNIIIDCDPGTDDAIAMCAAIGSNLVNLLGVTIVGGNVHRWVGERNARDVLAYVNQSEVPVFAGANRPLKGFYKYAYHYHGRNGLCTTIPSQGKAPHGNQNAVDFINETLEEHPEGVSIFALGPLTNIAKVLAGNSGFHKNIDRIYVMGGAFQTEGNVTPFAEFNVYQDPLAANLVFSSDVPVSIVGLDVCNDVYVSRYSIPWLVGDTKRDNLCSAILEGWFDYRKDDDKYILCDPLTVASAINQDLIKYEAAEVSVVENGIEIGRTIAEFGKNGVDVATEVDAGSAYQYIASLIS